MPFVGTQLSGTIFGTLVFSVDSFDSEGIQFSRNWFVQKGPEVCFRAFLTLFWLLAILKAQNWQGLGHFRTSKLASFWHFFKTSKIRLGRCSGTRDCTPCRSTCTPTSPQLCERNLRHQSKNNNLKKLWDWGAGSHVECARVNGDTLE